MSFMEHRNTLCCSEMVADFHLYLLLNYLKSRHLEGFESANGSLGMILLNIRVRCLINNHILHPMTYRY